MIFTIDNGLGVAVRITGDVMKTAVFFSEAMPTTEIAVFAMDRGRMVLLNGEVILDIPTIGETNIDLNVFQPELEYEICDQWTNLITKPLWRPMTLLERFRLAKAEDVLDYRDNTTESDVVGYGQIIYGEYLDSLNIRAQVEI
jgi:hypothetical protein